MSFAYFITLPCFHFVFPLYLCVVETLTIVFVMQVPDLSFDGPGIPFQSVISNKYIASQTLGKEPGASPTEAPLFWWRSWLISLTVH